jgi:glycogen(starch) synthase
MKVLFVSSDYLAVQSGTGAHTQFLTEALRAAGVDVTVVATPILSDPPAGALGDVEMYPQIGPEIVWHDGGGDGLVGGVPAPEWTVMRQSQRNLGIVAGIDRNRSYDVIHFQGFRVAPAAAALGRIFDAPIIFTKSGSVLGIRVGEDIAQESPDGWSPFTGWSPFALEYVRAVDVFAQEIADRVITISDAVFKDLVDPAIAKARIIRNGADLPACTSECSDDRAGGAPTIGFFGRLVPQKGPDIAVEALALLDRSDVRLSMAGAGPLLDHMKVRAAELGVADRVEFTGVLDRDELHRFLHRADLIVLPSRWDALPNAIFEAQSLGKVVISCAVDGVPEQIRDGETGLLCPPCDPSSLAEAIEWTLEHPVEAKRIEQTAAEWAAKEYSWHDRAEQTMRVYAEVVNGDH